MNKPRIVIIDTGCANFTSVKSALDKLDANVKISFDFDDIKNADKLILPGVGTAKAAMSKLNERNLVDIIKERTQPILGICLGMQMLAKLSEEKVNQDDPTIDCLGIIDAKVKLMQVGNLRLPHMGWNQVDVAKDHPLFKGIKNNSYFYFVHSYAMELNDCTVGTCQYGEKFTAVVQNKNFMGTQFHPEKSGKVGAQLLKNFLEM